MLDTLLVFWIFFNVISTVAIEVVCFSSAEHFDKIDILLYPLLIRTLRAKLNIVGTVIVTILVSILCCLAIIAYFVLLALFALSGLLVKCFLCIFKRKD